MTGENESMIAAVRCAPSAAAATEPSAENQSTTTAARPAPAEATAEPAFDLQWTEVLTGAPLINNKIDAMREESDSSVYAIDFEWDTIRIGRQGRKKDGKVRMMQIGFWKDGTIRVFLIRLENHWKRLPDRLLAFLRNTDYTMIGVNVKNDLTLVGTDFGGDKDFASSVNFINLGMYARQRDIVQNATIGLRDLTKVVLDEDMDKDEDIRCSKWSARDLAIRQKIYAALDVVKPLEIYKILVLLPDLSQRLHPDSAVDGVIVDIVPPHARNNILKAATNFRVGDLATRAAVGRIITARSLTNPSGIWPERLGINRTKCCTVEVTEVLAPSLCVLGHKVGGKNGNQACL